MTAWICGLAAIGAFILLVIVFGRETPEQRRKARLRAEWENMYGRGRRPTPDYDSGIVVYAGAWGDFGSYGCDAGHSGGDCGGGDGGGGH